MEPTKDDLNDLFSKDNVPESNFFKFTKVGDRVGGTLISVEDKPAKDVYGPQRVFTLKTSSGESIHVGIQLDKQYVISRAETAQLGDILGFEFVKEIPASKKGHHPAKSIEVYVKHVERNDEVADF